MKTIAYCSQKDMYFAQTVRPVDHPEFYTWEGRGLTFALNNLSGFKNWHKYHVKNKTNITVFALARACVCVCVYIYIYMYIYIYIYIY